MRVIFGIGTILASLKQNGIESVWKILLKIIQTTEDKKIAVLQNPSCSIRTIRNRTLIGDALTHRSIYWANLLNRRKKTMLLSLSVASVLWMSACLGVKFCDLLISWI